VQKFGMELGKEQQLVGLAADIMIEIYMAESAILKAKKVKGEARYAMAKLNLFNAVQKIEKAAKEAIYYFASDDEQRMMLMGIKRFTKYVNAPNPVLLRRTIAKELLEANKYCF